MGGNKCGQRWLRVILKNIDNKNITTLLFSSFMLVYILDTASCSGFQLG